MKQLKGKCEPMNITEKDIINRDITNNKEALLENFGVSVAVYASNYNNIEHRDGVHNYRQDSLEATRLVMKENKDIPDDLKARLLYYKEIINNESK